MWPYMPLGYYFSELREALNAGNISRHHFSPNGLKFN